jgi:hypothetical protein
LTWYAFKNGHPDIDAQGVEEKLLSSYGFHGYATRQQADRNPNSVNPLQMIELGSLDADHAAMSGGKDVAGAVSSVPDFLSRLTSPNTWQRAAEIAAGLLLLYVGLTAATRGTPVAGVTNTVKKVASHVPK